MSLIISTTHRPGPKIPDTFIVSMLPLHCVLYLMFCKVRSKLEIDLHDLKRGTRFLFILIFLKVIVVY